MLTEKDIAALLDGAQTVDAIHRAIADPQSAAVLLGQIQEASAAVAEQHQSLAEKTAQFEAERKKTNAEFDERHEALTAREAKVADLHKLTAEVERRAEAVKAAERAFEDNHSITAHAKRESALKEAEAALLQREKEMDSRAVSLAAREARIADQEVDYKRRMEGLRALAG